MPHEIVFLIHKDLFYHECTLKIMFGNLYMEMNVIKISIILVHKSIMKLIIIITKQQQQNAAGTFMILLKSTFK